MKTTLLTLLLPFVFSLAFAQNGKVQRIENFASKYVQARNIDVWLPEGYNPNDKTKYSVLYMHDGQNLYDSTKVFNHQEWGVDETMTQLLKDKKIRNCIVVGIWNTDKRFGEYLPQKPFESLATARQEALKKVFKTDILSDNYLKFIVEELKPYIDKNFKTKPKKEDTFMAGSSMGGLISLYAQTEYPSIFGGVACISTHWLGLSFVQSDEFEKAIISYWDKNLPAANSCQFYFDYGTLELDAMYEPHQQRITAYLQSKGFDEKHLKTQKFAGETHNENSWKKRFYIPVEFLLK